MKKALQIPQNWATSSLAETAVGAGPFEARSSGARDQLAELCVLDSRGEPLALEPAARGDLGNRRNVLRSAGAGLRDRPRGEAQNRERVCSDRSVQTLRDLTREPAELERPG